MLPVLKDVTNDRNFESITPQIVNAYVILTLYHPYSNSSMYSRLGTLRKRTVIVIQYRYVDQNRVCKTTILSFKLMRGSDLVSIYFPFVWHPTYLFISGRKFVRTSTQYLYLYC